MLLFCSFTTAFSVQKTGLTEETKPNYILSLADWQILCGVAQRRIAIEAADQAVTNLLSACNNTLQFIDISFVPHKLHDYEKWGWQECQALHAFVHLCTCKYMENYHFQQVEKNQKAFAELQNKLSLPDVNEFLQNQLEQVLIKKEK